MTERTQGQSEVDRFILDRIESVPHLEALLLVWCNRPKVWTVGELAERLYVEPKIVGVILDDLVRSQLLSANSGRPPHYGYESRSEQQDHLMQAVQETYRLELVRISNLIHSKPSAAMREFARAFRFTKERE